MQRVYFALACRSLGTGLVQFALQRTNFPVPLDHPVRPNPNLCEKRSLALLRFFEFERQRGGIYLHRFGRLRAPILILLRLFKLRVGMPVGRGAAQVRGRLCVARGGL